MKLKVGDVVEFKKYENVDYDDRALLSEEEFPKSGKVKEVITANEKDLYFFIEESPYCYSAGSVARVISDVDDHNLGVIIKGDEVLVRATVKEVFNGSVKINPSVDKNDIAKILKRKEPEHFIVQDDNYGMYIGTARELVSDNSKAKIYTSRNTANEDAADMHLNAWEVIKYGD